MLKSRQQVHSSTVATGALLLFGAAAFPSDDPRFAFSQGRVWLVILCLTAMLLLHLNRWHEVVQASRILFNRQRPFNTVLAGWWLVVLLSDLLAPDAMLALKGSSWGQMGGGQLGLCVLLFYLGQLVKPEDRHWKILSMGLGVMLLLTVLEGIGLRPLFWLPSAEPYPATTVGQRGHLAGLFAVAAGFAAYRRAFPTFLVAGLGIAFCNNTSALIGYAAVAALALLLEGRRNWRPIAGVLALTVGAFLAVPEFTKATCTLVNLPCTETKKVGVSDAPSLGLRLKFWQASWGMIKERPLLGWGDEQYEARWLNYLPASEQRPMIESISHVPSDAKLMGDFPNYFYVSPSKGMGLVNVSNIHPHNVYIEELQNHGLIGLGLLVSTTALLFRLDKRLALASFGYGIYLMAWFFVFSVLPVFTFLLGIAVSSAVANRLPSLTEV